MSISEHQPLKQAPDHASEIHRQFLDAILGARDWLRFGSIEITVHDSKVMSLFKATEVALARL